VKRRESPTTDPRAHRAARLEELIELYGDLAHEGPWPTQLAAVRAGEPFEVHGWQLPRECGSGPYGRYRVDSFGRVVRISRASTARRPR
jgi:hypothetical protein